MGSTAIRIVNILLREVYFTPLSFVFPSFLRYGDSIIRVFVGAGFFSIKKKNCEGFLSLLFYVPHLILFLDPSRLNFIFVLIKLTPDYPPEEIIFCVLQSLSLFKELSV